MENNDILEKGLYEKGLSLMDDGNHDDALKIFEELAAKGNSDAMIYAGDIILQKEIPELQKKAFKYFLTASKTSKWAWGRLCFCYANGMGTKTAYAEAVRYGNMVLEKNPEDEFLYPVYLTLGQCYAKGNGTRKDVCKGYRYLKIAENNGLECDAKPVLEELCNKYPFKEDGEIDLSKHKRSKLATLFIWITLLTNLGYGYMAWEYCHSVGLVVASGLFVITCLLLLFWKKIGAYMLMALPLISIAETACGALMESNALVVLCFIVVGGNNFFFVLLTLLFLQKRRKGYAIAWNSLMGKPDDGRSKFTKIFDFFLRHGDGPKYLPDSTQTKTLKIVCAILTLLVFVFSGLAAWAITELEWDVNIEWNCFNSPKLYSVLCVLGFFFQFFKGNWVHFSYETYEVYLDENNRRKEIKKQDFIDTMEGSFIWPLICHIFLYPMFIGAVFYYLIMWGFSIIQDIMPYILAVLIFLSASLFFIISQKMLVRKYRIFLIALTTLCFVGFYRIIVLSYNPTLFNPFGASNNQDTESALPFNTESALPFNTESAPPSNTESALPSNTESAPPSNTESALPSNTESALPFNKVVRVTSNNVDLRMKPDAKSPILVLSNGEWLEWADEALTTLEEPIRAELLHVVGEEGEWYKAVYCAEFLGTDTVYVKKDFCKDVKLKPLSFPAQERMGMFYEIPNGKYKGMVLGWHWGWHDIKMSQAFQIGQNIDGVLQFTHDCSFRESQGEEVEDILFETAEELVFNKKFFVMDENSSYYLDLKQIGSNEEVMDYIFSNLDKMSEISRTYYGVEGDSDWHIYIEE